MSEKKTAGAFDVRTIIGTLLATYGVILTAMGLFADTDEDGPAVSTPTCAPGIALLVVGAVFLVWARLRPIVVPDHTDRDEVRPPGH